jgi:AraC-like DNA-binding protein
VTRELTVAASTVCSLLEFAISKGASRETLVQRSGIDPAVLRDRDNRIPFSKYVALMRAGQLLCRNPALALHFGESVDCSEITLPVGGATNIGDAVTQGNRYAPLAIEVESVGTADRFCLVRDAGQLWLVDNRANPNDFPELTESGFARMVCSTRRLVGELGLSRQTLFRKLKAEGVMFQQVLDQLRHKLALHHLTTDKASVQRTARLVGFSDATAFSRAFKRWTGLSPREYVGRSVPPA